ncbi:MAG: PKD domain-containing protein [Desulfovibrio sp.]
MREGGDGNGSFLQAALVLPERMGSRKYSFLYITGADGGGIQYSTLLDTNGTTLPVWLDQNSTISGTHPANAITAVGHENKFDTWIISYMKSLVSTPSGPAQFEVVRYNGRNYFKHDAIVPAPNQFAKAKNTNFMVSPDGEFLAYGYMNGSTAGVALYSFNAQTGDIIFKKNIEMTPSVTGAQIGGVSFSSNSGYLYVGVGSSAAPPAFYQVDLGSESFPVRAMNVPVEVPSKLYGAQLSSNGTIYYSTNFSGVYAIEDADDHFFSNMTGSSVVKEIIPEVGVNRPGLPLFDQTSFFKTAVSLERSFSDIYIRVDKSLLPEGNLEEWGLCLSKNGNATVADTQISLDWGDVYVAEMQYYVNKDVQYHIRSYAKIDGQVHYYDEMIFEIASLPEMEITTPEWVKIGEEATVQVKPLPGCQYVFTPYYGMGDSVEINESNATFVMGEWEGAVQVTCYTDNGTSDSKMVFIQRGPLAKIETARHQSNAEVFPLVATEVEGGTYTWRSFGNNVLPITNLTSRVAQADPRGIADGTSHQVNLVTVGPDGFRSSKSAQIIVHTPPTVDVSGTQSDATAGAAVTLSVSPVTGCTYLWEQQNGTAVTLSADNSTTVTFQMPVSGSVGFRVTVADEWGVSSSKFVEIKPTTNVVIETPGVVTGGGSVALKVTEGAGYTYEWSQTGGPAISLINANTNEASFDSSDLPDGTELTFSVTVITPDGQRIVLTKVIVVRNAPTIDFSLIDKMVVVEKTVFLNVPYVAGNTYHWEQVNGTFVDLLGASTSNATCTMPMTEELGFKLTVQNDVGLSTVGLISIDREYEAIIETPAHVSRDGLVQLIAKDTNATSYFWAVIPSSIPIINGDQRVASYDPSLVPADTPLKFYLAVGGHFPVWVGCSKVITAHDGPAIDFSGIDTEVSVGELVKLTVPASSGSSYLWEQVNGTAVSFMNADNSTAYFQMPDAAEIGVKLTVTNEYNATDSRGLSIIRVPDARITSPVDVSNTGGPAVLTAAAGAGYTYYWEQVGGPSVTLLNADSRQATFDTSGLADGTVLSFKVIVTDEYGVSSEVVTTITVRKSPVVVFESFPAHTKGGTYAYLSIKSVVGAEYHWEQIAGANATYYSTEYNTFDFWMPEVGDSVTFKVTVTNVYGLSGSGTITIDRDLPPVAVAGPDQTVSEGDSIILSADGSSEPNGDGLAYFWTQSSGPIVTLTNANESNSTFVVPNMMSGSGSLVFDLRVMDPGGQNGTDSVIVNVTSLNSAPIANAGPDFFAQTGDRVELVGSNSYDADGDVLTYAWESLSGGNSTGLLSNSTEANPWFVTPDMNGTLNFRLTVTDSNGLKSSDEMICTVRSDVGCLNFPVADAGPDRTVTCGELVTINGFNSHAQGEGNYITQYSWSQNSGTAVVLGNSTTPRISFVAPENPARLVFDLAVVDRNGLERSDSLVVNVSNGGAAPVANAGIDQSVESSTLGVTLDGTSSSTAEGTIVRYLWKQVGGVPVNLSSVDSPMPSFDAPSVGSGSFAFVFQLEVTNSGGMTNHDTVIVNVNSTGAAIMPVAIAKNDVNATVPLYEGMTVALHGGNSTAPLAETIESYSWGQVAGPLAILSDPADAMPTFVCPATDRSETLVFELTVTDSNNMRSTARTSVAYEPRVYGDVGEGIEFASYSGLHMAISSQQSMDSSNSTSGEIVALKAIDPADVNATGLDSSLLTYGLIDFTVRVATPGAATEVVVQLPEPAPESWIKLDSAGRWVDYTEHVKYSADRRTVTLTLVDGGIGDDDGVANGVIVDPSGPGVFGNPSNNNGGWIGGCVLVSGSPMNVDLLLLLFGSLGLMLYRRRIKI